MSRAEQSNGTHGPGLDRILVLELARVTEAAAIAAAQLRGRGNEKAADKAAVDAMRRELGRVEIRGTVVIGEGEMDEAPMLYIGEKVGTGEGPEVDIAVDPLEGTTICAKAMPNALAVLAISERGGLFVAAAAQPRRGHGRAFRYPHELKRQDALDDLFFLDDEMGHGRSSGAPAARAGVSIRARFE